METQKDAMKVIGDMAKGKTPFDAAAATKAANDIGSTAKKIPELFPEGTGGEANKSDALPAIWEKWDRFKANADDLASRLRCARQGAGRQRQRRMEARVSEGRRSLQVLP